MFKPLTEEERKAIGKQKENIKKIADALIGKRSIKINLDTVGPRYFTKGFDGSVVRLNAGMLVGKLREISGQDLKFLKVEGNILEIENLTTPKTEKWKITDVEFTVE
ncbi:TPA: hypothetical protein OHP52_001746 [Escherichia coli]|nr:hypothetical protein [Escherichia coli]